MRVAVHASDIDGIVSAALVLMKHPNAKIDFLTLRDVPYYDDVEYDLVIDLPKTSKAKINIDHHLTNYERLIRENRLGENDVVDPKAPSAASLVIRYLGLNDNAKARKLVEMANIADTGGVTKKIYKLDKIIKCYSRDPSTLMKIAWILVDKGVEFEKDKWIKNEWKRLKPWITKGLKIARKISKELIKKGAKIAVIDIVSGFPRIVMNDLPWIFINKGGEIIVIINRMKGEDPICPSLSGTPSNNQARVSIRVSRSSSFDARKFAEKFGGGGHPKAAGMRLDLNHYEECLGKILLELSRFGPVFYMRLDLLSQSQ
ncbi:MAG: DHHA1 domain-containing protein [Candidatus Njordarchaeales archaeon]